MMLSAASCPLRTDEHVALHVNLLLRAWPLALMLLMAACTTAPPADPSSKPLDDDAPPPASLASSSAPAFEQRQRDKAVALAKQGRLADAALAWEILTVLKPDSAEYRERLADTQRQIEAAAADRTQRAAQAQKRGELDYASSLYLSVLALQPEQAQAAEALRSIERERNKRNYLGKYSRLTLARRATVDAEVATTPKKSIGVPTDRNELEHASMLATQGEFDAAIALLERHIATDRRDEAARQLLADVYYQKAEKIAFRDKPGAMAALEKSVRLDANHTRAAAKLKQLKSPVAAQPAPAMVAPRPAANGR